MMTTNYTHIFNDNLDMFDTTDCMGIEESIRYDELMRREDEFHMACNTHADEEDESLRDYLRELKSELRTIMERCGVYGAERWAEVASIYSDVYKDLHGFRPSEIRLYYHGFRA